MNKEQLLKRFEDMASSSISVIKDYIDDTDSIPLYVILELTNLIWATKELTEIKESEIEQIIERELGLDINDLMQIEDSLF